MRPEDAIRLSDDFAAAVADMRQAQKDYCTNFSQYRLRIAMQKEKVVDEWLAQFGLPIRKNNSQENLFKS